MRKRKDKKYKADDDPDSEGSSSTSEYVTEAETPNNINKDVDAGDHDEEKGPEHKDGDSNDTDQEMETGEGSEGSSSARAVGEGSMIGREGSMIGKNWNLEEDSVVPVTIAAHNVFYSVQNKKGFKNLKKCKNPFAKERLYILKDLNITFKPGEVTAILGPSGAGKTTLLNLLAGRLTKGHIEGQIHVNGVRRKKIPSSKWQRLTAYVMQDDILLAHLTPRETFNFAACLRIPGTLSHPKRRKDKVNAIIEELGLSECANVYVGSPDAKGISGGQRKRVSIGVELITDPSVLFLDEPTTGLDSSTSYSLVTTLKKLAMAGRTIITTIHQPSSDIFFKFDRVIIMAKGHLLYNGRADGMVAHFTKLGYKCPKLANPCEFVMNIAKDDSYISTKEEGEERVKALVAAYRASDNLPEWDDAKSDGENHDIIVEHAEDMKKRNKEGQEDEAVQKSVTMLEANLKPNKSANFFVQFIILFARAFLSLIRHPMLTRVRVIQTLFLSLVVGILFLELGDDQDSIQNRNGSLFFTTITISLTPIMLMQVAFPVERLVFIREHSTGSYSTLAYFLSKVSSEVPWNFVFPTLFSLIVYFMVGYDLKADKFFIYLVCLIAVTNTCGAFGMALVTGFDDMRIAMALMPLLFTPMMLLGGLFLNSGSTPDWLIWAKYLSPLNFAFEILALNEYDGLTFTCTSSERINGTCPISNGAEEIRNLGLDKPENGIWIAFLFMLMLYLVYMTIAFLLLWLTAGRRKGM